MKEEGEVECAQALILPGNNRWYTHHGCLKKLIDNKNVLVHLIETNVYAQISPIGNYGKKKQLFSEIVKNESFWEIDIQSLASSFFLLTPQ